MRIFAADGTEYVGFVELGVTTTNAIPTALTMSWSNMAVVNNTASTMTCALASTTLTCTGGNASELNSGIKARRLFQDITSLQDGVHTGNLTVTINNVTDTTINSDGTGHGVRIDGAREGSRVTGNLAVNHQTTGTKRDVQVRHRGQAGLYVKGRNAVTVVNGANVLFGSNNNRYASSLYGILAIATGTGNLTVTNNFATTIGFSAACTANCGANHRGIAASHIGTGDIDIVNAGVIRVTNTVNAVGMVGILAELPSSSAAASVSIDNTGIIEARDIAINVVGGTGKTATLSFNNGSRTSALVAYWSQQFGGNSTVGIASNAVVTGGITGGSGNETVTVASGGTWNINYNSSFGGGTDSITNRGIMAIGSSTQVSRYISITGLETFTLAANSTLRLYLDSLFGKVDISGTVTFNGSNDRNAPIMELFLPAGYDSGSRSAFTLIDASAIVLQSTLTFSELARRLIVRSRDGTLYDGDFTLSRATGGQLQLAWGTIGEALNCRLVGSAITCSGGSASSFEFVGGFDLDDIFRKISSLSSGVFTGDLTVNLGSATASLAATVNTAGTGHGIELDGTVTDSRVTGSVTVNNQTASATKRDIQVRGANKAALYVRSSAGVTINNAASLVFKPRSGNTHGSGLRGIEAISAGTGSMTITNNTGTTIGFSSNCSSNCGTGHRGIFVNHSGSGTVSISNSGNINVGSGAAVALTGGSSTTAATINLTSGTVTASEIINSSFAGNITMTMSGGSASGRITLGGGNDTVTVNGGTLTLANGISAFGGGTDSLTVNNNGTLIMGNATNGSKGVTVTGLETFTVHANTTMGLYLSRTSSVFDTAMTLSGRVNVNAAVGQDPTALHVYLPSGYSISDQNYFTLLRATAFVPNSVFDLADLASQVRIFAADGTEYVGFVELGVTTTNSIPTALTMSWSNMAVVNNTASTMSCALASTTLTCTGGNASELNAGINARRLFQDITSLQDGVHTGNLTVTINNVTDTTINSDGTGHGVRIDGAREGSRVTGSLTVNHQTTGTKRDVQVRHRGQAGLYVKGRNAVTVVNGANVLFGSNNNRYASSLYGILAIATGTGDLTVTNNFATTIGFSAACTANCGANHRGIAASHIGTGNISVSNAGIIRVSNTVNAVGMVGILAELSSSSAAASVSIVNTGTIEARDIAVNVVGGSGKTATIRFNGGSRVSSLMAYWSQQFGGNSTVTIASNAVVTGGITGGTGNETVTVAAGGTWNINYNSSFGGGTDSITNRGIMAIGSSTQVSRYIGITGLETFTLAANSTLRLYLDSLFGKVDISGTVTFNGSSDRDAPILELFLPAGYDSGSRSAFTLIDASAIVLQSTLTFSELARRLIVRSHDGTVYDGDFTLSRATGGQLQLAWGTIGEALNCRLVGTAITCSGGSASSFEFVGGFDLDDIFRKISSLSSGVFTGEFDGQFWLGNGVFGGDSEHGGHGSWH